MRRYGPILNSTSSGDVATGVVITAMNALSTLTLYTPLAAFYPGVGGMLVPIVPIAESVIFFAGLPLAQISRKALIKKREKSGLEIGFDPS